MPNVLTTDNFEKATLDLADQLPVSLLLATSQNCVGCIPIVSSAPIVLDGVKTIIFGDDGFSKIMADHSGLKSGKSKFDKAWVSLGKTGLTFILTPVINTGRASSYYGRPGELIIRGRAPYPLGDVPAYNGRPAVRNTQWAAVRIIATSEPGVWRVAGAHPIRDPYLYIGE